MNGHAFSGGSQHNQVFNLSLDPEIDEFGIIIPVYFSISLEWGYYGYTRPSKLFL